MECCRLALSVCPLAFPPSEVLTLPYSCECTHGQLTTEDRRCERIVRYDNAKIPGGIHIGGQVCRQIYGDFSNLELPCKGYARTS